VTSATGRGERTSRRLTEISRALTYARSLEEVLELTVECAIDLLAASRAVLMLMGDDDLLHVRASRGIAPDDVERFREPLDENLLFRLTSLVGPEARERFLGVPLVVRGDVIGLLGVRLEGAEGVDDDGEWRLSALADQAAVALESTLHRQRRVALVGRVEELERDRRLKEQAIEILGHDLRSPLGAIQGYVVLMSEGALGPVTERQREVLERILRVQGHLEAILANVLEMGRLTGGEVVLRPQRLRVGEVVSDALDIVRPAAEEADIICEARGEPEVEVETDPDRLRQVLVQLLDNAVKYSPDGSLVVVTWRALDAGGQPWVDIAVEDQGPGVPPERQEAVFEPYVREDGHTGRGRAGVGLGLAISMGIVGHLGGTLTLESGSGEGSTFRVRLPATTGSSPGAGSAPER
jgi:signal transduction histidine kinase